MVKTNSVLILISNGEKDEKILVYVEPKKNIFHGKYRFPGGSIELKEKYTIAIVRELREEFNVEVKKVKLLYKKLNIFGGALLLCSGTISDTPKRCETEVGEPEWKSAEELFNSNLVPDCKILLYKYILQKNPKELNKYILTISDTEFISIIEKEAKDIYNDFIVRFRINQKS